MNIAFINSTRKWGGVKTHTLEFASRLSANAHKVFIYARQKEFLDAAAAHNLIPVNTQFGSDFSPVAIAYFIREFKNKHIDIVIGNVGKDIATAGIAARLLGIPLVQHLGAGRDIAPKFKYKILHRFLDPIFFCTADFIAEEFLQTLPWAKRERIRVVLNGKETTAHPLSVHTPRRLVAHHQLVNGKGYETIFRALAQLDRPFIFEIVGTGPQEQEFKTLAAELGLEAKVIWHGFMRDPMHILKQSDIFLLASTSEGLPNTLLEALSAGLLPICRNVGGVKEVWPDNFGQWLLPYEANEQNFAQVIEKALELSDMELLELKRQSREACGQKCDIDTLAVAFEQCLLEVIKNNDCVCMH